MRRDAYKPSAAEVVSYNEALKHPCPYCRVRAGERCRGARFMPNPHQARLQLADETEAGGVHDVAELAMFLAHEFGDEIGDQGPEWAVQMAKRLLLELKEARQIVLDDFGRREEAARRR